MVSLILGLITAAVAGTTAAISGGVKAYKAKQQAQRIKANAEMLQGQIERGEIQKQEALKRLNTMIDQTSGELRDILGKQINDTIDRYTKQYEKALKIGTQQIKDAMIARRMGASEALLAGTAQQSEQLGQQYTESVENIQQAGLDKLYEAIRLLNEKRYGESEEIITDFENYKFGMENEIMQLENASESMFAAGGVPGQAALGFLSGNLNKESIGMVTQGALTYDPQSINAPGGTLIKNPSGGASTGASALANMFIRE